MQVICSYCEAVLDDVGEEEGTVYEVCRRCREEQLPFVPEALAEEPGAQPASDAGIGEDGVFATSQPSAPGHESEKC
jgi:hypothetical protein